MLHHSPRVDARCLGLPLQWQGDQAHSWFWPRNWSDLLGLPRTWHPRSNLSPPVSLWLIAAQESPQTRPALQGLAGLPVVPDRLALRQLPHWTVTPESDFPTSWLQHVWPKGPGSHALHNIWHALSLGLRLANFLRKKNPNYLISFPSGTMVSFGRRRGCWKKKKKSSYFFLCMIRLWNPVIKMYVGERTAFGWRTHSKTYWPEQSASHMLPTDDLYEYNQYSPGWGGGWPSLAAAKSPWKNKGEGQMALLVWGE